jgi:hypothetical protein
MFLRYTLPTEGGCIVDVCLSRMSLWLWANPSDFNNMSIRAIPLPSFRANVFVLHAFDLYLFGEASGAEAYMFSSQSSQFMHAFFDVLKQKFSRSIQNKTTRTIWKFFSNFSYRYRYALTDDGRLHVVNLKTGSVETSIVAHEQVGMTNMMVDAVVLVHDNDGNDVDRVAYFHWKLYAAFYYFIIINCVGTRSRWGAPCILTGTPWRPGRRTASSSCGALEPMRTPQHVSRRSPRKYFTELPRDLTENS